MTRSTKSAFAALIALAIVFSAALGLSACKSPLFGLGDAIDMEAPKSISVSPGQGSYRSGSIVISGQAADNYGLASAEVRILDKATGDVRGTYPTTVTGNAWATAAVDTTAFPDGPYTIAVTLKDARGNSTEDRVLITFDNRAPTVLMDTPLALDVEYNGNISIAGDSYDGMSAIVGVSVALYKSGQTTPFYTGNSATYPKWNVIFNAADPAYGLSDEDLTVVVTATDEGGNKNAYQYEYKSLFQLNANSQVTASQVDLLDSKTNDADTISGLAFDKGALAGQRKDTDAGTANTATLLQVNVNSDQPTFTFVTPGEDCVSEATAERYAGGTKANGTIRDDDLNVNPMGVEYRYVVSTGDINAASWNTLTYESSFGKGYEQRWSFPLPGTNGIYKIQLRARDKMAVGGVPTADSVYGVSGVRYVIIDDGRPLVSINTSLPTAWKLYYGKDQHILVTGSANRDGVGNSIAAVEIQVGSNPWTAITGVTGIGTNTASWSSYELSLSGLPGGSTQVRVRARDNFGVWGQSEVLIIMDVDAPIVSINDPGSNLNGSVTFRGTTTDGSGDAFITVLSKVEAKIDSGTYAQITGTYSWSNTVNTQGLSDGSHTLWVRSYDTAGNVAETSRAFTVLQSTDKPSVAVNNLSAGNTVGGTFIVSGTAGDDDGVSSDASAIQMQIEKESSPGSGSWSVQVPWANVTSKSGSALSTSWTYGLGGLASGSYRLQVRARDLNSVVGNFGSGSLPEVNYWNQTSTIAFIVDNDVPVVAGFSPVSGSYVKDSFTLTGTITEDQAIATGGVALYVNGTPRATASVTGGTAPNFTFSFNVDKAWLTGAGGSNSIRVEATDMSNPAKTGSGTMQVVYDHQAPTVTFLTPDNAAVVNGTIHVTGTVADDFQVQNVYYKVATSAPAFPGGYDLLTGQKYAFDITVNTTTLTEDADFNVYVVAVDAAGNDMTVAPSAPAVRVIHVDQDSDRPVIKLSNIDADGVPSRTTLKMSRTVFGSVSDDDGTINPATGFRVSENGGTSWTAVPLSGGTFAYTASAGDGTKTIVFEVTDKNSKVFTTGAISPLDKPRVENGAGYIETSVSFDVDETNPTVYTTVRVDRTAPIDLAAVVDLDTNMPFGGSSTGQFALRVLAKDTSGIKQVTFSVPGATPASSVVTTSSGTEDILGVTYNRYDSAVFNVTGIVTNGALATSIVVEDNSGLTTPLDRTIIVDNKAPTYAWTTPANNEVVNGDVTVKGTALDEHAGLATVEYKLGYNAASESWTAVGGSIYSWEIGLTGANKSDLYAGKAITTVDAGTDFLTVAAHGYVNGTAVYFGGTSSLPAPLNATTTYYVVQKTDDTFKVSTTPGTSGTPVDITSAGTAPYVSAESKDTNLDEIWEFPIQIRATDKAGNQAITTLGDYMILLDPGGDKPKVTVSYPDAPGKTLGGAIRVYGLATDDDAVNEVYMRLDADSDGTFDSHDDNVSLYGANWYGAGNGLKVNGSSNWYYTINSDGKLNPSSGTKTIKISVRARDIYGTYGTWSAPMDIIIDKNVPTFGTVSAVVVDPDATAGNGNSLPYSLNMYVSGSTVYLRGSITDDGGISAINVSGDVTGSLALNPAWFPTAYSSSPNYGYEMAIPVDLAAGASGTKQITITALDNSATPKESVYEVRFYFDNQKPTGTLDAAVSPPQVVQDNGWYKVKGTAEDTGSDVERVEVYFVRKDLVAPFGGDLLYYPGKSSTSIATASLNATDWANYQPTLRGTVGSRTLTTSLTDAALIGNGVIMPGQTIMVGSNKCTISAFDSATGKIDWIGSAPLSDLSYTVRLALQVDHKDTVESVKSASGTVTRIAGEEKSFTAAALAGNNDIAVGDMVIINGEKRFVSAFTKVSGKVEWTGADVAIGPNQSYLVYSFVNDDRDYFTEYLKQTSGITYTWSVDIRSDWIPDGNIEIHYVVYDKAGNAQHYVTSNYKVKNNGPRMGAVILGSDLNGNGNTTDTGERIQYSFASATDASETKAFPFVVKDGPMYIEPVVTNGNGDLKLWMTGAYTLNNYALRTSGTIAPITTIDDADLGTMGDGSRTFTMAIWDSTAEGTPGSTTLDITRGATITVDYVDGVPPTAAIRPFYWNSSTDNSLYGNSKANGHIEITGVTLYGADPDVSGQISVRGVAYDDQRLTALYAYMDGYTFTGGTLKGGASFYAGYTLIATYASGTWTPVNQWSNGWKASVTDAGIGQDGHRASWQLDIDTGKAANFANIADLDRVIRVVAEDRAVAPSVATEALNTLTGTGTRPANNSIVITANPAIKAGQLIMLGSGDQAYAARITSYAAGTIVFSSAIDQTITAYTIYLDSHQKPFYQVDVVPYVSEITTALSKASPLHPSDYNRSALGFYPVRTNSAAATGESIVITGFNLNPNTIKIGPEKVGVDSGFNIIAGGSSLTGFVATVGKPANTSYTVSIAPATASGYLNFINRVGASSTYIGALNSANADVQGNREANGRNNDRLTDDRYMNVWDLSQINYGETRMFDMAGYTGSNTLNFSFGYRDTNAAVALDSSTTPIQTRSSYTRYFDNRLALNDAGQYFQVAQCGDTETTPVTGWGNQPSHFGLSYNRTTNVANLAEYATAAGGRALWIESNWNGSNLNKLDRVQLPDIKVKGNAADSTVYLSYYDSTQKLLKARIFRVGTGVAVDAGDGYKEVGTIVTGTAYSTLIPYREGGANWDQTHQAISKFTSGTKNYTQGFVAIAGADANSPHSAVGYTNDGTAIVAWFDPYASALKLKYNPNPTTSFSGYQAFTGTTAPAAGSYTFRLTVDGTPANSGNAITFVYDPGATNNMYEFAYQLSAFLSNGYNAWAEVDATAATRKVVVRSFNTGTGSSIGFTAPGTGTSLITTMGGVDTAVAGCGTAWTERTIDSGDAGKYVSIATDGGAKGGIHLSYQKTSGGDLRYAYLPTYDCTDASIKTYTVDAYNQVGSFTDIGIRNYDVDGDTVTDIVPYISYFAMSNADTLYSVKVAHPTVALSNLADGVDAAELFTGKWEVQVIPASEVAQQYRVNNVIKNNGTAWVGYLGSKLELANLK